MKVAVLLGSLACLVASSPARAFGGLWSSQGDAIEQAGVEVIFVDHPDETVTAVVRVLFTGPAAELAWVIPVPATPTVSVSSSTVFERLAAATSPEHWLEVGVEGTCSDGNDALLDGGARPYQTPTPVDAMGEPVVVIEQGSVGSYDYVTLEVDRTLDEPAETAIEWLSAHGYELSGLEHELLDPYLQSGHELLAFRLRTDREAGVLRPIVLTYASERPLIPIRLASAAAQRHMPLRVWVIGPSQAVPRDYDSLVLNDALIDWPSGRAFVRGTLPSGGDGPLLLSAGEAGNYDALVSAAADEAGGRGFVTELGAPASQFREKVWSPLDEETFATFASQTFADGIAALLEARAVYGRWDGFTDAVGRATTLPAGVSVEQLSRDPERYRGMVEVDGAKLTQALDELVVRPVSETAALLYAAPYLTRLATSMSAADMTRDPAFGYNQDLAQVDNVHVAKQRVACSPELKRAQAPWQVVLPQGGMVEGDGSDGWPFELGSMPASLAIVKLGERGPGAIVTDNRDAIARALSGTATGMPYAGAPSLRPPQHGVTIGGDQSLFAGAPASSMDDGVRSLGDGPCHVAAVGASKRASTRARTRSGYGAALVLACLWLVQRRRHARALLVLALLAACSDDHEPALRADGGSAPAPLSMSLEQLRDPETCKDCHPNHYREWSSSMHAYASQDPVFLAMNRRGQRETDGQLGDFCIKCHAPMAVVDGLSSDGLNLAQLPDATRGVSCYFCHNVTAVEGDHNAQLRVARDDVMRGPIRDPLQPGVHRAAFSELFEDTDPSSSAMCGACHDIVTQNGVHLERTLEEYQSGIFSKSATGEPPAFDSCSGCHMPPMEGVAAVLPDGSSGPERTVHEHVWPGIDVALTDFPHREAMRSAVEDCQLRRTIGFFTLEVTPPDLFTFQIETSAGHHTPSGAAQDRRLWLEVLAYDERGELLPELSSGDIADDAIEEHPEGHPEHDPQLRMFRDRIYDAHGEPVHMFWEAAKSSAYPEGYASSVLPVATTTYIEGKHAVIEQYRLSGPSGLPARVTARLRMRPIGLDVLQDLVDSGDLDPAVMAAMPTFSFGAQIEWTAEDGLMKTVRAEPNPADCTSYRCLLDSNLARLPVSGASERD